MSRPPEQTKSAIDRIGERLKDGDFSLAVLEGLDAFRSSHDRIVPMVLYAVGRRAGGTLTLRAAKSTASIVAKLRRESVRLSQIQDIAGCRIIVSNLVEQGEMLEDRFDFIGAAMEFRNPEAPLGYRIRPSIGIKFKRAEDADVGFDLRFSKPSFEPVAEDLKFTVREINRLAKPQFGYRAIHVVVGYRARMMEIQVRTQLQHAWAELSEKAADKYGHGLKYGNGDSAVLDKLMRLSGEIAAFEDYEADHYGDDDMAAELGSMRQEILDVVRSEAFNL